jgi:hypothetical protein
MHEANRRGEAQNAIDLQRSIDTAQSTALAYSVMRVVLVVVVGVILAFAIRLSANRPVQSEFREREFS